MCIAALGEAAKSLFDSIHKLVRWLENSRRVSGLQGGLKKSIMAAFLRVV